MLSIFRLYLTFFHSLQKFLQTSILHFSSSILTAVHWRYTAIWTNASKIKAKIYREMQQKPMACQVQFRDQKHLKVWKTASVKVQCKDKQDCKLILVCILYKKHHVPSNQIWVLKKQTNWGMHYVVSCNFCT